MDTVSILTICTGKYNIFFQDFYKSCESFFLKDYKKTYYVFTDGEIIESDNIVKIYQEKLGWPYDTMMRFKMFNSIIDKLKSEYVFFFNVNMLFVDNVGIEVLPKEENGFLMGVEHPGFYQMEINEFTYERRYESCFYISEENGRNYFQGCFNGGRTKEFMKMSSDLDHMINMDLSNGIIPIWHDESALNWYYSKISPLVLSPSYAYPESWSVNIDKKIVQLDKNKFGGHNFLRM